MAVSLLTFVAERQERWDELGALVERSRGRVGRLQPAEVRQLGRLYRAGAADLALGRRAYPGDPVVARLEDLLRRARPVVYGASGRRGSLVHFATTGYWQRVAERPRFLAIAALALLVPALVVGVWAHANPVAAERVAQVSPLTAGIADGPRDPDTEKVTDTGTNAAFSSQIFTNNARVALTTFAAGVTAGVLTLVLLGFNGLILGLAGGLMARLGYGEAAVRLLAPHGILELSLIIVSGAAGLRMGWALLRPGRLTRAAALATEGRAAVEMALGAAVLLVPCGLVEGFITPRGLTVGPALAVGIGLAACFWGLVVWRGRPDPVAADR